MKLTTFCKIDEFHVRSHSKGEISESVVVLHKGTVCRESSNTYIFVHKEPKSVQIF